MQEQATEMEKSILKKRLCPCRRYATEVRRAPAAERERMTASPAPEDSVKDTAACKEAGTRQCACTETSCSETPCSDAGESSQSLKEAPAATACTDADRHAGEKDVQEDDQEDVRKNIRAKIRAGIKRLLASKAREAAAKKQSQGGFTLIEVLGALVVGSIVFAFAAFGISGGLESARVSGFNESLALLRINIHESYASSRGFGSSTTASVDITQDLIDAGAIPQNWMTADGASAVHNFGGSVSVSGTVSGFTITASSIPEAVCRKIVSSQLEGWDSVSIGGNAVTELPPTGCEPDEDGVGVNELTFLAH